MSTDRDEEDKLHQVEVRERRRFTSEGERRPDVPSSVAPPQTTAAEPSAGPEKDFSSGTANTTSPALTKLIIFLAQTASLHLGMVPDQSGAARVDLGAAREIIDLLSGLDEKTKGNLSQEEATLLKGTLNDLQMAFVQLAKEHERKDR